VSSSSEPGGSGGLLRSNLVVAAGTALSRVTGLVRLIVLGVVIGQTALADAYDGANNSPNALYELLLGGVLSASLVPLFTRHLEDDDNESTSTVITTMLVILAGLTALAVLAAPLVFRTQSFTVENVDPGQYRSVGTSLARIFLIQIFFYGLSALWGALLSAHRRFFAAAWSPVLANLITIAMLFVVQAQLRPGDPFIQALDDAGLRRTLSYGATFGIAAMALSMYPAVRRTGFRLTTPPSFSHPAVRQMFRLSGWTLGYAGANVITASVIKNLASPGSGIPSAYTRAFTVFQLPHGLLAMSITTTFVPELVRRVARKDRDGFVERAGLGVRMIALLTLPAAGLMFSLRRPIASVLLEHGKVTSADALHIANALGGFSVGLAAFSIYLFVLRGDARTPFIINLVECVLNVAFAVVLVSRYDEMGLGLAFGLAYVVCAAWALQILSYKVPGFPLRQIGASLARLGLATVVLVEVSWLASRLATSTSGLGAATAIALGTPAGLAAFAAVLLALGAPEIEALKVFAQRGKATPQALAEADNEDAPAGQRLDEPSEEDRQHTPDASGEAAPVTAEHSRPGDDAGGAQ
jgi:putative peptidoglycan lipid II flippase